MILAIITPHQLFKL